jgi:branched-chain amino acid transport system substrate-binding protein
LLSKGPLLGTTLLIGALFAVSACDFLINFDDTQCNTTSDCESKAKSDPSFAGTVCSAQKTCIQLGAGGGSGGGSSTTGGGGSVAQCTTNQECVDKNGGQYMCRNGGCVALLSDDCPEVVGHYADPNAVLFGMMAPFTGMDGFAGDLYFKTVGLAVNEFDTYDNGIPGGPGGTQRPLVFVACDESKDPEKVANHLVKDLGVPAIIGPARSTAVLTAAQKVTIPAGVMILAPTASSPLLDTLGDHGLVWEIADTDTEEIGAFNPMLAEVEAQLRSDRGLMPSAQIKVAMIIRGDSYGLAYSGDLTAVLKYNNGKDVTQNGANFSSFNYPDPTKQTVDYSTVISGVIAYQPDIIIPIGQTEMAQTVVAGIESGWPGAAPQPYYAAGSFFKVPELPPVVAANAGMKDRIRGVAVQEALGPNYSSYLIRYNAQYHDTPGVNSEYWYDAAYVLAYATVASSSQMTLSGTSLATAMGSLASTTGTTYNIGPNDMMSVLQNLVANFKVQLDGTTNLLNFDLTPGHPRTNVDVWCVNSAFAMVPSGQYYDITAMGLTGTYSCM